MFHCIGHNCNCYNGSAATQSQMPFQAYAMGSWLRYFFSFSELSPPLISVLSVMVFAFCFQFPVWLPVYQWGLSTIGVCTATTLWSIPMAGICTSLCSFMAHIRSCSEWLLHPLFWAVRYPPAIQFNWWDIHLWGLSRVTWSLCHPYIARKGLLFQVFPMTQLTPNLWWALNLVFPVWWYDIKLINLLVPVQWSILLFISTFILGMWARCQH